MKVSTHRISQNNECSLNYTRHLMHTMSFRIDPLEVETNVIASCGEWSPNGQYFAVGGTPLNRPPGERKAGDFDQVSIFSSYGAVSSKWKNVL